MAAVEARRFMPSTGAPLILNRASRSVEVIWSTGLRSRNFVQPHGWIMEELDMAPSAVRMDVLRSGRAPVLDTHRRDGAAHVLGRVVAARIEGGRGYATCSSARRRMSSRSGSGWWTGRCGVSRPDTGCIGMSSGARAPAARRSFGRWIGSRTRSRWCRCRSITRRWCGDGRGGR